MADGIDYEGEFQAYLRRFEEAAGDAEFGAFVKNKGRLVQKMSFEEFKPVYADYFSYAKLYFKAVDNGDTINDQVVRTLRKRATELFLQSPA